MLAITNTYGNVELAHTKLSKVYAHVRGKNLQPLCRKLGIKFAQAVVGFTYSKYGNRPQVDGVVVSARSAPKLRAAIAARSARNTPEKRAKAAAANAAAKAKRAAKRQAILDDAGIADGTRTAKWLLAGEIDRFQARLISFKTEYRHEYTDYDDRLRGAWDRDDARAMAEEVEERPATWPEYLAHYGFNGPIAQAMAKVLKDPLQAHPIWFCQAALALERANVSLDGLTYQQICAAIQDWQEDDADAF